ncbi:MAG: DUF302 domain-containing protein [Ignavibacteria bacterium]
MKNIVLVILLSLASLTASGQTEEMFIESESRFGYDETVKVLEESITGNGWKILITHDLQASMKKAGKEVLPVKIFEVCNPKHSYKLLSQDDKRVYSSLMPCRFSVYEKEDGKVYVSRMNSIILSKQIGGLVEEVMTDATNETEKFLKAVVR